jgi:enoyl-CoA hydratase
MVVKESQQRFHSVHRRDDDGVVWLAVSHAVAPGPDARRLAAELVAMCEAIETEHTLAVAVVLTCPGPAFWVQPPGTPTDCDALGAAWGAATAAVARLSAPTIAVIEGDAIGPGWELALACDLRIAAPEARVGSPEVALGRMPTAGGTQRLARLVGRSAALHMLLLSEIVPAPEALVGGLVHRVGSSTADEALVELLAALRRSAPIALAYTKEAVRAADELTLEAGLRLEADLAALLLTTADRAEGVAAALERRPPTFRGL